MQPWPHTQTVEEAKLRTARLLTVLILSTSGSVSMAVAPVEPSESPPTVRCSLDVERGREGGREEGREKGKR